MIDWVSWPLGKNIDKWIIALLKGLAAVKKFSILIEVSLAKIEKVGGPCPSPGLQLFPLSLARGSVGLGGRALGLSPKLAVTRDNSLPLCGPQVSHIDFSAHSRICVCHFGSVYPSIPPIRYLCYYPSVHRLDLWHVCVLGLAWVCCFISGVSDHLSGLWLHLASVAQVWGTPHQGLSSRFSPSFCTPLSGELPCLSSSTCS